MKVSLASLAAILRQQDRVLIITHQNPDGDTLGCGYALCAGLRQLGKQAAVYCADPVPKKFSYMPKHLPPQEAGEYSFVVAVDVAAPTLLGKEWEAKADEIDLCIDHHPSNTGYAKSTYVDGNAAAACEIIYQLLRFMSVTITPAIADCLYTGLSTDTGCFRFSNTTSNTHRIASYLMECGANVAELNEQLFNLKSRGRLLLEREALDSMEFYADGRIAVIVISRALLEQAQVDSSEIDGVSGLPRQIEGVEVGITLRECEDESYKVSVRTTREVSASAICAMLGGGGHACAAGCRLAMPVSEAKETILKAAASLLSREKGRFTAWTE